MEKTRPFECEVIFLCYIVKALGALDGMDSAFGVMFTRQETHRGRIDMIKMVNIPSNDTHLHRCIDLLTFAKL